MAAIKQCQKYVLFVRDGDLFKFGCYPTLDGIKMEHVSKSDNSNQTTQDFYEAIVCIGSSAKTPLWAGS